MRHHQYHHGILLKIAYDGRAYSGLALQDNAHTVSAALLHAIRQMAPEVSSLRVCSRTDAGVHAVGQYVAFDTNAAIGSRGWLLGITGNLPRDVAILRVARVPVGFQPCRHALSKTYRYTVLQGTLRDPFLEGRAWRVSERLNHGAMRRAAQALLGTHDFRAFRGRSDLRVNTVRTITGVSIEPHPTQPRVLEITVEGNAFLYHMVRIIAGTLVDIGRGKRDERAIARAVESGNRLDLGMTAPAAGLFLVDIQLDEAGTDHWPYHLDGAPADSTALPEVG